jgi:hypothetical protein
MRARTLCFRVTRFPADQFPQDGRKATSAPAKFLTVQA